LQKLRQTLIIFSRACRLVPQHPCLWVRHWNY